MGFKSGVVKCFFLSLIILSVGCAELTSLREEKVLMTQRIEELQSENQGLDSKYATSEEENARLIEEKNRLEDAQRSMEERLKGTGVSVKIKEGHISVVLPSSVLFNSGQIKLKKAAKNSLSKVCRILEKDFPNESIRVEGHTDNDPIKRTKQLYKSNWELSAVRAATVLHYLIDNCHLDPTKLYLAGFGEFQPLQATRTRSVRRKIEEWRLLF